MSTLFFAPQFPSSGRYTSWWYLELIESFKKHFNSIVVLGNEAISNAYIIRDDVKEFSNINQSIIFELDQIEDYLKVVDIHTSDDVLFLSDLSFPGIFTNVLYTKKFSGKKFAFCHATSKNKYDIFSDNRTSKFKVETGHSLLFDKVFVGSEYHKRKLGWNNIEVTRVPNPPDYIINKVDVKKNYDIISVSRPCNQKVMKSLEDKIEKKLKIKIERKVLTNPEDYSKFLSESKILLISSKEDTFNYTILDSIKCGCIPIAPNNLCFPEILPREYLYNNHEEACNIITSILDNKLDIPEILCKDEVDNFYENICQMMKSN